MQIAVLGGGNGSFAAAGDFALAGHAVRLWRRDQAAVTAQQAAGNTVIIKDFQGRRTAKLAAVTSDIGVAVRGAELISVSGTGDCANRHCSTIGATSRRRSGGLPTTRHLRLGTVRQGRI